MKTNDIASRHAAVIAILRSFRGFAKLHPARGFTPRYRETHDVIQFTTASEADGTFTPASIAAAEARATDLVARLRGCGLAVEWNGSFAFTISIDLNVAAPAVDIAL